MLYTFLKYYVGFAFRIYCRQIRISPPERTRLRGPLLIACNHPNSFLDAVLLDILFDQPIHSLARGDVFFNRWITKLLEQFKILPVYRPSEGVENLNENYKTFDACVEIFRKGGVVLIFSEGLCVNEWHLRPLKKGTARLAIKTWEQGIPLRVLPTGINYSSFKRMGKSIRIHFGNLIQSADIPTHDSDGARHLKFNARLAEELKPLVYEIPKEDRTLQKTQLLSPIPWWTYTLLTLPAFCGWLAHAPFYYPLQRAVRSRFGTTGHYDSVLMAVLIFAYPFYLALIALAAHTILPLSLSLLLIPLLMFGAWALIQIKPALDRQ